MGLWQDVQFALRLLLKDKWFSLIAVVALALGIGVNAAVFTFVNAVLIRGLPYADSDRIMALNTRDTVRDRQGGVSYLDFRDWAAATKTFSGLGAYTGGNFNISDEGRSPERFNGAFMSSHTFRLLGQAPLLGRDFRPEEDRPGSPSVVMISSKVWKNRYGSDPNVIGRSVRVNEAPAVIIGVMPDGFGFPFNTEAWQPLSGIADLETQKRNSRNFQVFGRLAPEVSQDQATAEMVAIGARLAADYPDTNKDIQPNVQTINQAQNGGPIRATFLSLMGAVAFVLLIACANVANLLLARSAHRSREISVRVSIGASRWRIIRQLLVESILLALIAGVLGLALSVYGIRLFDEATVDAGRPYWIQFTMDTRVFVFLAAVCLGTGIIFGLAPALHVARTDVNEVLKEGGRSGSAGIRVRRWSTGLIIGELALTLALLAGAGFMMRNFLTLYRFDLGIDTSKLITTALQIPERKYPSLEQRLAFYQRLQERLEGNPRIKSVTVASNIPMQGGFGRRLAIDGKPLASGEQPPMVTMLTIDPRYFETIGLPLIRGRAFTHADGAAGQETAIINTRFAQMHFPGEDPIGRRITLSIDLAGGAPPAGGIPVSLTATIIGIAPNLRQRDFAARDPDPIAYLPYRMDPRVFMTLIAKSDGDPNTLTPVLREEIRAVDADLPLFNVRTMDAVLAQMRWPFRVFGAMFALFAGIALVLSAVGLYAVTAYSVSQRTSEIGVRMALGAQSNQVAWLFLRRAFFHVGVGLTLGVAAALGVGRIFESANLLVQNNGRDPVTIGTIAVILAAVALGACFFPARRATGLDPVVALRRE